jgi:hypothetical protein
LLQQQQPQGDIVKVKKAVKKRPQTATVRQTTYGKFIKQA